MKNKRTNQQSQRGNHQQSGNSSLSSNGQNHNNTKKNSSRNSGRGKKTHQPHLWASSASSSTTLTSHLSMVSRRNQDGTEKKNGSTNGTGRSNVRPRVTSGYKKNGRTRDDAQRHAKKRKPSNIPNPAHKKQSPSEVQINSSTSAKGNQTNRNGVLESKTNTFGINPFELFCAYHLGISSQNQYRPSNINEVANRFKIDIGTTRQILKEYGMDSASLLDRDFDMALAQLDIQVAPEGINRTELGRNIFEDFLEAPIKKRDWKKILEDDRKENAKTFK